MIRSVDYWPKNNYNEINHDNSLSMLHMNGYRNAQNINDFTKKDAVISNYKLGNCCLNFSSFLGYILQCQCKLHANCLPFI